MRHPRIIHNIASGFPMLFPDCSLMPAGRIRRLTNPYGSQIGQYRFIWFFWANVTGQRTRYLVEGTLDPIVGLLGFI